MMFCRPVLGVCVSFIQEWNERRWYGFSPNSTLFLTLVPRAFPGSTSPSFSLEELNVPLASSEFPPRPMRELWMCCCFMQTTVECFWCWLVGVLLCRSRGLRFGSGGRASCELLSGAPLAFSWFQKNKQKKRCYKKFQWLFYSLL